MTQRHPQHDNMLIAAEDKDSLFECDDLNGTFPIGSVIDRPQYNWEHVKPAYKYQHVKDAWEADKSLVVQCRFEEQMKGSDDKWLHTKNPSWDIVFEYRIKPKTVTMRLYADLRDGRVKFLSCPDVFYKIPINGTETEVEVE